MANISHSARKRPILVLPGRGHGYEDSGEEQTVRRWVVVLVLCVDTYEREESFVTSPPTRHPPAFSPPPIIPARAKSKLSRLSRQRQACRAGQGGGCARRQACLFRAILGLAQISVLVCRKSLVDACVTKSSKSGCLGCLGFHDIQELPDGGDMVRTTLNLDLR
jgi:hypothetical protein